MRGECIQLEAFTTRMQDSAPLGPYGLTNARLLGQHLTQCLQWLIQIRVACGRVETKVHNLKCYDRENVYVCVMHTYTVSLSCACLANARLAC